MSSSEHTSYSLPATLHLAVMQELWALTSVDLRLTTKCKSSTCVLHSQSTSHAQGICLVRFFEGCSATLLEPVCAPAASLSTLATYLKASAPKAIALCAGAGHLPVLAGPQAHPPPVQCHHRLPAGLCHVLPQPYQGNISWTANPTKVTFLLPVCLIYRCPSTSRYTCFGMPCRKWLQSQELLGKLRSLGIVRKVASGSLPVHSKLNAEMWDCVVSRMRLRRTQTCARFWRRKLPRRSGSCAWQQSAPSARPRRRALARSACRRSLVLLRLLLSRPLSQQTPMSIRSETAPATSDCAALSILVLG